MRFLMLSLSLCLLAGAARAESLFDPARHMRVSEVREGMTGCWPVRICKPWAARWLCIASKSAGASSKAR